LLRSGTRGAADQGDEPQRPPFQPDLLTWWSSNVEEDTSLFPDNVVVNQPNAGCAFVLDDEPQIGALVCKVLQSCGIAPRQFTTPAPFLIELKKSTPELVVLDLSLGQSDAVEIIRHLEVIHYQGKGAGFIRCRRSLRHVESPLC
jgi:hypothetical protein